MVNQRIEPRMLCADTVDVCWEDQETGLTRCMLANLDDISQLGACLLLDCSIPENTSLRIVHSKGELTGKVIYCVLREVGYVTGVEFYPSSGWSQENFQPEHLYDPRRLSDLSR
jgi:hypothetical protein